MRSIDEDVARLRAHIEELEGGSDPRLPAEPELSAQLGVSRSRLRTMLKRVEEEGLIWRHVGKGTFVGPRPFNSADTTWSPSISVDDLFDTRLMVEPQLAAQAALHGHPPDITALEKCLMEMSAAHSFLQWKRWDDRLHRTIAKATHNALMLMLHDTVRAQARLNLDDRLEEVFGLPAGPRATTDAEHRAVVDAIRAHNPEVAERAMRDHIRSVRSRLFGAR